MTRPGVVRKLKKTLSEQANLQEKRIAVLGGSTTNEILNQLELYLLNCGIRPVFYESDYNMFFEEIMFDNPRLDEFKPDLVYIHSTTNNIKMAPSIDSTDEEVDTILENTYSQFETLWNSIEAKYGCAVIQNNFDPPPYRPLGNLDGTDRRGLTCFTRELNFRFAKASRERTGLIIHDIDRLASEIGLNNWHDPSSWYAYKCIPGLKATPRLAKSLAGTIRALFGKASKCLVLDLDNTLWGGIIGDDGVEGIKLGRETAEASAYLAFQKYIKALKERGIILAVCSKNEKENAIKGLEHPDSALPPENFTIIRANWSPKSENIAAIAQAINIDADSLVFFDDNPAEREIVRQQIPETAVIEPTTEFASDVSAYIAALDRSGLFETVRISKEDLQRNEYYSANADRAELQLQYTDYGDYLDSLQMTAEIGFFAPQYLERITQLTNKTNQFNLTTIRYTLPEIQAATDDPNQLDLYGRLTDKFGNNGLVSVILGQQEGETLSISLWLMSCRVFKREMELTMFDALVAEAGKRGIKKIIGTYAPTPKNGFVSDFYETLGFTLLEQRENGKTVWEFPVDDDYSNQNTHIKVEYA